VNPTDTFYSRLRLLRPTQVMASTRFSATGADRTAKVVEDAAAVVVTGAVVATEEMAVAAAEDAEVIAEEPLSEVLVATSRRASASQFVGKFRSHASLHTLLEVICTLRHDGVT
jgi:hypothetical protein